MNPHNAALIFIFVLLVITARSVIPDDHTWIQDIPTNNEEIWNACCSHEDCQSAKRIKTEWVSEEISLVTIDKYTRFAMKNENIHPSTTGVPYFCRVDIFEPPTSKNTLCVFVGMSFS